ncbi:DUF4383 domain-containing protein [Methylocystis parvus]|uniref:DUF4383 domain-containing protein n=1 Tax=Methylocystis parvus TaxID=134 RepID=A0A6B8MAC5_9HYPH|nr:DUF4383 domain-containing protein [Methylocystis parvus]QGM98549.1 DUF4383 domain-containing protein [Methylocystis parvus]WBK01111.1 DUF4383 domain-containing protein [Methylocystis parvus OBBP]
MATTLAGRTWSSADNLAKLFGVIFIIVGILGFIPNPLVSYRGLFEVNTFHNIVHIVSGGILLASPYYNAPVITLRVFGVIYAVVTILGFISLDSLNSMGLAVNQPDNWLHLILSIAILWAGFAMPAEERVTTAHM